MRSLTHLERLEAESIHIFREVVAEAENPVMLYSVGKDSSVMLHLARKAFRLEPGEEPVTRSVRFRMRGCYPLTGATVSDATEMNHIIQEMLLATGSERQGRAIDKGQSASMEDKKQEGYF